MASHFHRVGRSGNKKKKLAGLNFFHICEFLSRSVGQKKKNCKLLYEL